MPTLPITRNQTSTGSRKRSGVRATAADVPVVSPQSLRAPTLSAPKQAFESTGSIVAEELAPGLLDVAAAEKKSANRKDTVGRAKIELEFTNEFDALHKDFIAEKDFSSDEDKIEYGKRLAVRKQDLLDSFQGSAEARELLSLDLDRLESKYIADGAEAGFEIEKSQVDEVFNKGMAPLVTNALGDTSLTNSLSQFTAVDNLVAKYSAGTDSIQESAQKAREGKELIALAVRDRLILAGDLDGADAYVNSPQVKAVLGAKARRESDRKIQQAAVDRKSAGRIRADSKAKEEGKLLAQKEHIAEVFKDLGIPLPGQEDSGGSGGAGGTGGEGGTTGPGGTVDSAVVKNPFQGAAKVSSDMQDVTRLAEAARGLALAGKTAMAAQFMQQARLIISTSDEIANDKELDKLLSPKAQQLYGVKAGSTMRDVLGRIPPSVETQARKTAVGRAEGKAEVEAKEQIGFIDEASTMITDLQEELISDPNLVGILGSVRSGGQTITGVLGDVGLGAISETVKDMAFTDSEASADDLFEWFDNPTLSNLQVLENSIGLIMARLRTPSGRIPVDVIKRSIDDVKLSGLTSSQQVQNRLKFLNEQLNRRKDRLQKRFAQEEPPRNDADDRPDFKVIDGKLVPTKEAAAKKKAPVTAKTFPKVSTKTQGKRELKRKDILNDELAEEKRLLAEATNDEDKVLHNRNIKALEKELK